MWISKRERNKIYKYIFKLKEEIRLLKEQQNVYVATKTNEVFDVYVPPVTGWSYTLPPKYNIGVLFEHFGLYISKTNKTELNVVGKE